MIEKTDLIIRNARLRSGETLDIGITGGKISSMAPLLDANAATEINAAGNLVTESFVNAHLHL